MLNIGWPIGFGIIAALCVVVGIVMKGSSRKLGLVAGGVLGLVTIVTFILACTIMVPPGHAGVSVLFGEVQKTHKGPGLHLANPFLNWTYYDCRQKTHTESMGVPSKDQMITKMDVSVQYKIQDTLTPTILDQTGTAAEVIEIHMKPILRSVLREQGKALARSEDFFTDATQSRIQSVLFNVLTEQLSPKGLMVQAVLLRDIKLPPTIRRGVEAKKRRDQEAEKQKSELRRFETEQQQKVAQAKAELEASKLAAEQKKVLANAKAYEILKINEAIAKNPAYIQLEALKSLQAISKDKTSKIYFINGDSPQPLPLMHMGTATTK